MPLPAEYARAVAFARAMGTLIYRHRRADHIAAQTLGRALGPDDCWLTEQVDAAGTVQVSLVTGGPAVATHRVTATVLVRNAASAGAARVPVPVPRPLTGFEQAKLRARATALAALPRTGTVAYEPVVISWRRDGADVFYAYLLPAASAAGGPLPAASAAGGPLPAALAAGGPLPAADPSVRPPGACAELEVVLDGAGARVLATRRPGTECDESGGSLPLVTLAQRALPEPLDVFRALQINRPLLLRTATNGLTWRITGDRIDLLRKAP